MRATLYYAVPSERVRDWRNFLQESKVSLKKTDYVSPLGGNVWLIDEDDPSLSGSLLLHIGKKHSVLLRTLEFDLESQWLDHSPHA